MTLLDQDPGPDSALAGIVPSPYDHRDPARYWLIHGPTFVFAARCGSVDMARALVLDALCYGDRPELAYHMSARPATKHEVAQAVVRSRRPALKVEPGSGRRLAQIMHALHRDDLRHGGDLADGGRIGDLS